MLLSQEKTLPKKKDAKLRLKVTFDLWNNLRHLFFKFFFQNSSISKRRSALNNSRNIDRTKKVSIFWYCQDLKNFVFMIINSRVFHVKVGWRKKSQTTFQLSFYSHVSWDSLFNTVVSNNTNITKTTFELNFYFY